MHHQACLRDTVTFGVFNLWFFLYFVQVTSRVILSYMSGESNTIEKYTELPRTKSDVEEQGYSASLLEKLLILLISMDSDRSA